MSDIVQFILEQPWYILLIVFSSVAYFLYTNYKSVMDGDGDVTFLYAKDTSLSEEQQFAVALDAVTSAYWEVDNNALAFTHNGEKPHQFDEYMSGWFINTKKGYEDLTRYFLTDGRRSYFNFIYPLYKHEPQESWPAKMQEQYDGAARPQAMLARLSEHDVVSALIQAGVIAAEADMEIGTVGWDVAVLIGQARRAYTAGLITEAEALKTIESAKQMAVQHFNSWADFGRSQVIGMALDYYRHDDAFFEDFIETYKAVLSESRSPWNTIQWRR